MNPSPNETDDDDDVPDARPDLRYFRLLVPNSNSNTEINVLGTDIHLSPFGCKVVDDHEGLTVATLASSGVAIVDAEYEIPTKLQITNALASDSTVAPDQAFDVQAG